MVEVEVTPVVRIQPIIVYFDCPEGVPDFFVSSNDCTILLLVFPWGGLMSYQLRLVKITLPIKLIRLHNRIIIDQIKVNQ